MISWKLNPTLYKDRTNNESFENDFYKVNVLRYKKWNEMESRPRTNNLL